MDYPMKAIQFVQKFGLHAALDVIKNAESWASIYDTEVNDYYGSTITTEKDVNIVELKNLVAVLDEFEKKICEHHPLYKEGITNDQFYKGAQWAWQERQGTYDALKETLNELKEKSEALYHRWNVFNDAVALAEAEMIDMCVNEIEQTLKGENT